MGHVVKKLVYGVGINDADYVTKVQETIGYIDGKQKQKVVWRCPFYQVWGNMLKRGHSERFKLKNPTYKDVTVCKEWHLFTTFKAWMEQQDWEGNQIDKDLLLPGNKIYSPETCVFVSRQVNMFLVDSGAARGEYKIGVCWDRRRGKYMARCFTGKQEYLGYFASEEEAHKAWLTRKLEHAYSLSAIQTDERVARALIDRYEKYGAYNV
jgi:hypothetical protein